MKKTFKILIIFIAILMVFSITDKANAMFFDVWGDSKAFLATGEGHTGMTQEQTAVQEKLMGVFGVTLSSKFNSIIDFVWGVGLLVVFICTIILGIKYMFVSPEEKSRVKQATTPYIIGVVIIFGALTIWKLVIFVLEKPLA